ncbi:GNAT family N-acetyltransferase [Dokdonia sp. Hel_I_53]|uniref:GNAT family N-acetyltransferase n=1 Tax=Dokdonia sp. Hel_I_53 TaxID=1566287 RepID=UPI00119BD596|nr:GNAT family N-acetyltransferase [Dokdonia sp. Hel_I_53]TVZ52718.1 RimJ/RimL family protein N-acetyltransferase [Dokdonia sp. Hel_I_53]
MIYHIETPRLILREIRIQDTGSMYKLDSDPLVHKYLGNKPITCMGKARENVDYIRMQYEKYNVGRWATIEKSSGKFIGWSGLKMNFETSMNGHLDFYDIGYRFMPAFWGKGYATEASLAARNYFFEKYPSETLYGLAEEDNLASCRILQKIGLERKSTFKHPTQNVTLVWFEKNKN